MTRSIETASPGTEQPWADLERLAKAATEGPYSYEVLPDSYDTTGIRIVSNGVMWDSTFEPGKQYPTEIVGGFCCCCGTVGVNKEEDAAFIAAANPSAVLELIAAARANSVGIGAVDAHGEPPANARVLNAMSDAAARLTALSRQVEVLEEALTDLVSWFDGGPSQYGPWIIKSGDYGADSAVAFARAALSTQKGSSDE